MPKCAGFCVCHLWLWVAKPISAIPSPCQKLCTVQALAKALQLQDFDAVKEVKQTQTMLLAPPECHQHVTGPVSCSAWRA